MTWSQTELLGSPTVPSVERTQTGLPVCGLPVCGSSILQIVQGDNLMSTVFVQFYFRIFEDFRSGSIYG